MNQTQQRQSVPSSQSPQASRSNGGRSVVRPPATSGASTQPPGPASSGNAPQRFRFEKLEVWQASRELVVKVHETFIGNGGLNSGGELNPLVRWMIQTSLEIPDAIAEGSNRYGDNEMVAALERAQSGLARLGSELEIATQVGLVTPARCEELLASTLAINAQLKGFERFLTGDGGRNSGGRRGGDSAD